MKFKFFILLFLLKLSVFSQTDVLVYKDIIGNINIESIKDKKFKPLKKQILEKYSDDVYWFKIPAHKTNEDYVFRFVYERINEAEAYQNSIKLKKLKNQRFLSYQFSRKEDVYIKINPELHSYIPFELNNITQSSLKESNHLLLNGFYYGFAFLIIVYNLCYYILFRDDAFLYYALFLSTTTFGVFTMDGMLNFYTISGWLNEFIMVLNYLFLAFFASKFIYTYLLLDNYYTKLKKISYTIGSIAILFGILYLIFNNFYYLLILGILVFSLLLIYWICALLMFNKDFYIKIMVFAYPIILFSGIDYYILKFLGISIINIDAINIKIGAFLEMIILSFAVLYRMNVLKKENDFMHNEIVNYSKKISELSLSSKEENLGSNLDDLSHREKKFLI
ncbi:7TM-DISM domain-containing protein [Polaribacter porphyrae]|nr:7TM-DISM domain-containing protein [Polaribacter porphyrae]